MDSLELVGDAHRLRPTKFVPPWREACKPPTDGLSGGSASSNPGVNGDWLSRRYITGLMLPALIHGWFKSMSLWPYRAPNQLQEFPLNSKDSVYKFIPVGIHQLQNKPTHWAGRRANRAGYCIPQCHKKLLLVSEFLRTPASVQMLSAAARQETAWKSAGPLRSQIKWGRTRYNGGHQPCPES